VALGLWDIFVPAFNLNILCTHTLSMYLEKSTILNIKGDLYNFIYQFYSKLVISKSL